METKVCKKCGIEKSVDDFYADPKAADKLFGKCCRCQAGYQRTYRKNVQQDVAKYAAAKLRDRHNDLKRSGTENRKSSHRSAALKYNQVHPEEHCRNQHNRRARLRGNGGTYTVGQWADLKAEFGNACLCCGKSESSLQSLGRQLVPDHIVPIALGGLNIVSNLQPLCHGKGGCNNLKGIKTFDFRYLRGGISIS
jgi:Fe-S cluster biogenesis protein NfuA